MSVWIDFRLGLDVLGEKWTPNVSIVTGEIDVLLSTKLFLLFLNLVLLQIIALMADPRTDNPMMPAIAEQIHLNPQEFYETARKHTKAHAQSKSTS